LSKRSAAEYVKMQPSNEFEFWRLLLFFDKAA